MRLLNVHTLEFSVYHSFPPPYAIASHRWHLGHEASHKDVLKKRNTTSIGYRKVLGFAEFVKNHVQDVEWLWIDTCCILQQSSEEVSEAVNSMFKWYRNAVVCVAFLEDVSEFDLGIMARSRWFTRGWTLQELVAPRTVVFVTRGWEDYAYSRAIGAEQKLEWMADRETTREEDQSYCLLGFFDVTMPVIYGEGREKARMRLL
ncbi:hypothetical protein CERZMDRAFT_29498, partial [Cercospora zeae-maydis SCOH1-5]